MGVSIIENEEINQWDRLLIIRIIWKTPRIFNFLHGRQIFI